MSFAARPGLPACAWRKQPAGYGISAGYRNPAQLAICPDQAWPPEAAGTCDGDGMSGHTRVGLLLDLLLFHLGFEIRITGTNQIF